MKVQLANITQNALEQAYIAYRVCYSKLEPHEIKMPNDRNDMVNFMKPLIKNGHLTPLEHISMTFYITDVSRALMAQLTRHRTAKFNIQSQRYIDGNNFDFIVPESIKEYPDMLREYSKHMVDTMDLYNKLTDAGIKKEDARFILPNATTCNIIMTIDLRNFRGFYGLRNCKSAQWEIQELAQKMMLSVKEELPFADYMAMNCGRTCFECTEKNNK